MSNGNFSEIVGDSGEKAIEPLVMALDRYSTMLDQIAFSLDNVGPTIDKAATSFRGVSFSAFPLSQQSKKQSPETIAPAPLPLPSPTTVEPVIPESKAPTSFANPFENVFEFISKKQSSYPYLQSKESGIVSFSIEQPPSQSFAYESKDVKPINIEVPKVPNIAPVNLEAPKVPELTTPPISAPQMPGFEPIKLDVPEITAIEPIQLNAPKVEDIQAPVVESPEIPEIKLTQLNAPKIPESTAPSIPTPKVSEIQSVNPESLKTSVPPSNPTLTYSTYIPKPPKIPSPAVNPRLNPELDIALGLVPEPPTPVVPPTPAPAIPQVSVPQVEIKETQEVSKINDRKNVESFEFIGAISSSFELMNEVVNSITSSMKDMLKNIDIATESVRNFNQKIKDGMRPRQESATEEYAKAEKVPVTTAIPAVEESNRGFRESKSVVGGFSRSLVNATVLMKALSLIVEKLSVVLSPLAELVSNVLSVFDPLLQSLGKAIQIVANFLGFITKFFTAVFLSPLMRPIQRFLDYLIFVTELLDDLAESMTAYQKAQDTANKIVYGTVRNINSTIRGLVEDPLSAVPALIGQIRDAVETFNPGAMVGLDLAMRDLKAVFGEALLPVVTQLTRVLREFANVLRPILIGLAPVFEKLVKSISDLLISNINTLAKAIESLTPIIEDFVQAKLRELKASQEAQKNEDLNNDKILRGIVFNNLEREANKQVGLKGIAAAIAKPGIPLIKEFAPLPSGSMVENEKIMQKIIDDKFKKIKEIPAFGKENIEKRKQLLGEATSMKEELEFAKLRRQFVEKSTPAMRKEAEVVGGETAYQEALKNLTTGKFKNQGEKDFALKQFEVARDFLAEAMKKAMAKVPAGTAEGLAAPMNPQYKAIADLTRETMLSAFIATSVAGGEDKKQQDDNARKNVAALPKVIEDAVVAAMQIIKEKQAAAPGEPAFGRGVA